MSAENNFTEGKILPALIKFALPVVGATLLQSAYGAVDLLIVGHFGDAASVSAVGSGCEVMMIVTCIIMGLAMGTTVIIGQYIGSGNPKAAGRTVGSSIALFAVVAIVLSVLMEFFAVPMSRLMKAPAEAFDKTVTYVRICAAGIVFIVAYNMISSIFRGLGNSKLPMIFVAIAATSNVFGDLLLCGALHMDVAGAAIATIAAQALSVVISLAIIRRQSLPFTMERSDISLKHGEVRKILKVGTPLALQDSLVHFSFLAVNAFANGFGLAASAGYGVGNRVTGFLFMIPSATGAAVTAVVSQNVGAGKFGRAREAMRTAMVLGVSIGVVLFTAMMVFTEEAAGIFTKDPAVVEQAALLIRGFAVDCVLTNILFAFTGFFDGNGNTAPVMLQGLTSALLVRLPVSYLVYKASWGNLFWLGLATPIATAYGIVFFIVCYKMMKKRYPERFR